MRKLFLIHCLFFYIESFAQVRPSIGYLELGDPIDSVISVISDSLGRRPTLIDNQSEYLEIMDYGIYFIEFIIGKNIEQAPKFAPFCKLYRRLEVKGISFMGYNFGEVELHFYNGRLVYIYLYDCTCDIDEPLEFKFGKPYIQNKIINKNCYFKPGIKKSFKEITKYWKKDKFSILYKNEYEYNEKCNLFKNCTVSLRLDSEDEQRTNCNKLAKENYKKQLEKEKMGKMSKF